MVTVLHLWFSLIDPFDQLPKVSFLSNFLTQFYFEQVAVLFRIWTNTLKLMEESCFKFLQPNLVKQHL